MAAESKTMRAVQFTASNSDLFEKSVPVPVPGPGQVRVKVMACGICHSDCLTKYGLLGVQFPRAPGHEIAGVIDALGPDVKEFKEGERVGVGWVAHYCGQCNYCRTGDCACCVNIQIPGIQIEGGYNEYVVVSLKAVARIPDELSFVEAAPLMCAGITTFNSLRHTAAKAGDVVAVVGVGGLGHMAIQFASKMGFKTVAISRGSDKKEFCFKLGASVYIDSKSQNVGEELTKLGGAKVILVTATSPEALVGLAEGLGPRGQILLVAALAQAVPVNTLLLLGKRASLTVWASGDARDSEDTMKFAALTGIRAIVEEFPMSKVNEAFNHAVSDKARFRVVLNVAK